MSGNASPTASPATSISKVGLVSLGCPKPLTDSERILKLLSAEGDQTSKTFECCLALKTAPLAQFVWLINTSPPVNPACARQRCKVRASMPATLQATA